MEIAMNTSDVLRAAGGCYHGYFCAGPGGVSNKLGTKQTHELGGMKHEVDLRQHATNKEAFIAKNGAAAYRQRANTLTQNASKGAAKLSRADVLGLAHERNHLIMQIALGRGTKAEQAKMRQEAVMIQRHLSRAAHPAATKGSTGHTLAHHLSHLIQVVLHSLHVSA